MIQVENITKRYGTVTAVDKINFEIEEGEIVGFLGPNGAGKSTTMNMITGFIEPSEGKIVVDGYDISRKPKKAKRQIGYMPEGVPLYADLTVKEFVTYMAELKGVAKKQKKEMVQKAIENTGLAEVQNKLIRNLSRGYKQRVSMAGALVSNPKVIILDEPTVGLDPKQVTEIRALIKELGKDHTVILSSHILSEVSQICNRVIIINKGKIVAVDSPENLENRVVNENAIYVTVEDSENKMETVKGKIAGVKEITLLKENEDKTKKYMISAQENVDFRKKVFETFAKEGITIFEMKKVDATLEDAFMKLINTEDVVEEQEKDLIVDKKALKAKKKEEKKKQKQEKTEKKKQQKQAKAEAKKNKNEDKKKKGGQA